MPTEEKVKMVEELSGLLSRSNLVVLADYRGLTVADMASLRKKLRAQGVNFRVTKNTLMRIAADNAGKSGLTSVLEGPIATAFVEGDPVAVARSLADFERTSRIFKVRAGIMGQRVLSASDITTILATLPAREVLLSQVVAGVQSPIAGLVGVLSGVLGGLVGTLEARRRQLEEQAAA